MYNHGLQGHANFNLQHGAANRPSRQATLRELMMMDLAALERRTLHPVASEAAKAVSALTARTQHGTEQRPTS